MASKAKTISAKVGPELDKRLGEYSVRSGQTTSKAINVLLEQALDHEERKTEFNTLRHELKVLVALVLGNLGLDLSEDSPEELVQAAIDYAHASLPGKNGQFRHPQTEL